MKKAVVIKLNACCESYYIGQTGRTLQKRYKEHKKAQHITNQSHSNYADQLINENHSFKIRK